MPISVLRYDVDKGLFIKLYELKGFPFKRMEGQLDYHGNGSITVYIYHKRWSERCLLTRGAHIKKAFSYLHSEPRSEKYCTILLFS